MENTENNNEGITGIYQPKTRQPQNMEKLGPGCHLVKVGFVKIETDKTENPDRDWNDVNQVIHAYLYNEDGIFNYYMYVNGYKKFEALVHDGRYRKELFNYRKPKSANVNQFAIDKRTNERVVDEFNSERAQEIIDEFATAVGNGNAIPFEEMRGKELWIEIKQEFKFGKTLLTVTRRGLPGEPFVKIEKGPEAEIVDITSDPDIE